MNQLKENKDLLPTNDIIFSKLFGEEYSKKYLIDFLSSIINMKINNVSVKNQVRLTGDKIYYNNDIEKYNKTKYKYVVLDIIAETDDCIADIEIQVRDEGDIISRSLFYWSKLYFDQLKVGYSTYEKVKKVIAINILQYEHFKDSDNFVEKINIKRENSKIASDVFEMYIIQIPKLIKHRVHNKLADWIYFLIQDKEGVKNAMVTNKQIEEAQKKYEELISNEELYHALFLANIARMDKNTLEARAKRKGREEGIKKGVAKERKQIVLNMHKKGVNIDDISKFLEISKEEVNSIIKEAKKKL